MKFQIKKSLIVLAVLFILLNLTACTQINSGEVGVTRSLGKIDGTLTEGLNWINPLITEVHTINIRNQTIQDNKAVTYTKDGQPITITYDIIYRVLPQNIEKTFRDYNGDPMKIFYKNRIETAIKDTYGGYTAMDAIQQRELLRSKAVLQAKKLINPDSTFIPIEIIDVVIPNIDFTDAFEKAIEEKQVASEKAKKKNYELQSAKIEADISIQKAIAEAETIKLKSQALQSNPKLVELTIAEKWDGKSPTVVVTNGNGSKILLPISK